MRFSVVSLVLGLYGGLALFGAPNSASIHTPSPPALTVTATFRASCASCHGANGAGTPGVASFLTPDKYEQRNDLPYFEAIRSGIAGTDNHAFGSSWSNARTWALVVHIRELQKAALRAQFGGPLPVAGVYKSQRHQFRVETVVPANVGLSTPWSLDWLPDGRMLVSNRTGSLWIVANGILETLVENTPPVFDRGQGGLLDVAVHPRYKSNGWVYLAFSDPKGASGNISFTKLVRGKIEFVGDRAFWTRERTVFETPVENYSSSEIHFGTRIVFDRKGHVFLSVGERGSMDLAQDRTRPNGKVFRLNENGSIPADNPFTRTSDELAGRIPAIWSFGHRNPQGLALDLDGNLWDAEHGPKGGDELNLIQKGANYGWPKVCYGINYTDTPFVTPWPKPSQSIVLPAYRWIPSIAPSAIEVVRGPEFRNWRGDFLVGGLVGQTLERVRVQNGQLVEHEELIYGLGRIRDVALAPDGSICLVMNAPDRILRLVRAR